MEKAEPLVVEVVVAAVASFVVGGYYPNLFDNGTPYGSVVHFNFPARGKQPPVTVKWYEGPTRRRFLKAMTRDWKERVD